MQQALPAPAEPQALAHLPSLSRVGISTGALGRGAGGGGGEALKVARLLIRAQQSCGRAERSFRSRGCY